MALKRKACRETPDPYHPHFHLSLPHSYLVTSLFNESPVLVVYCVMDPRSPPSDEFATTSLMLSHTISISDLFNPSRRRPCSALKTGRLRRPTAEAGVGHSVLQCCRCAECFSFARSKPLLDFGPIVQVDAARSALALSHQPGSGRRRHTHRTDVDFTIRKCLGVQDVRCCSDLSVTHFRLRHLRP